VLLTNAVEPHASDIISEAWFYVATHFLTEIWDRRCWHQKAGIFFLILSQKMGINILGGPLRKSFLHLINGQDGYGLKCCSTENLKTHCGAL